MSFILDALRKSEHDRQRQAGPGIADLRPAAQAARFPAWAIALAALLLANIVVVVVLVMRNDPVERRSASSVSEPPAAAVAAPAERAAQPQATAPSPSKRAAANVPASVFSTEGLNTPAAPPAAPRVGDASTSTRAQASGATEEPEILEPLPTIDEMAARGIRLPELHLDIHVFVARSSGRFVFINQRKYREGARLPEGPVVEQITREGVVLSYGGTRFLMPRP